MDQSIAELRQQSLQVMLEIESRLASLSEEELKTPATWNGLDRNVRFLMHRLTAHALDHALQVRKGRQAIGAPMTEAQGILAQFRSAQAALTGEMLGLTAEQFAQVPAEGEWSAKEVLEHVLKTQRNALKQIEEFLAAGDEKK